MKLVDGKIEDAKKDGRWVDVDETSEGGASIRVVKDDLECLDRLSKKLIDKGLSIEVMVSEKGDEAIIADEDGEQIPFVEVMKAVSD